MSREPSLPNRFVDLPPGEDPSKAGHLFRSAIAAPEEPLPPITGRIRHTLGSRTRPRRRLLRVALASAAIFFFGGVVGAAVWPRWSKPRVTVGHEPRIQPVEPERKIKRAHPTIIGPAVAPAPMAEPAPIPTAETAVPPPATVPKRIAFREARPVAPAPQPPATPSVVQPPVAPSAVDPPTPVRPNLDPPIPAPAPEEHAYLARALRVLRDDRNATAALAVLDDYVARIPHRALDLEAGMLRAEALLSLGRTRDALAEFDRLPMRSLPNRDERLALRGELRAAAGRYGEAIADFDAVLARAAKPGTDRAAGAVVERALWGRASSRSHLGNDSGARTDLGQYLLRFPNGRFANEAKRLLAAP